jgi:hypothetical protein
MSTPFLPGFRNSLAALGRGLRSSRSAPVPELRVFLSSLFPPALLAPEKSGANSRERLFTVDRTFWLLLFQALTPKTSLREACLHLRSLLERSAPAEGTPTTGAYSRARGRFPLTVLYQALHHAMNRARARVPRLALLQGRDIFVIDGTSLRLADTDGNQRRFPQPSTQAKGCGFPVMKVLGLFCLRSGAAVNFAIARQSVHDTPLARKLWRHLPRGSILLGDRAFGDFVSLASLPREGVDVVARLHHARLPDFRNPRRRLGRDDAIFVWDKPLQRPAAMGEARWRGVPEMLVVRVVRCRVERPGFRTKSLLVATTLLDAAKYPAAEIAEVYLRRWRIELSFRDIKTTMEMEHLRARSPDMALKELLAGLVAYNVVRVMMAEAARRHDVDPARLSFKGTVDGLRQYCPRMVQARSATALRRLERGLFRAVARDPVPLRPGRREPRAVKRRPKPFPLLTQPRRQYREISHRSRWNPRKSGDSHQTNAS